MSIPVKISPSLLAADFTCLGEEVRAVASSGADELHLDIMDGHFVPNISFGPAVVASLRPVTDLIFDVHLMLSNPGDYIEAFAKAGAQRITVHTETGNVLDTLDKITALGIKAGISIKPDTPAKAITDAMLEKIDRVLVMTVEPGFGGQIYQPQDKKIAALRARFGDTKDIAVDGGINRETAPLAAKAGANVLIAGSAVFGTPDKNYQASVTALRDAAQGGVHG